MSIQPPVAARRAKELTVHGETRIDPYYWLRDDDRKNPEVLDYLHAETEYAKAVMAHTNARQRELVAELRSRIKEDDESVPVKLGNYWYSTRYSKGREHPEYVRRPSLDASPELLLDVNELAEPFEFYNVEGVEVSPNGRYLAFSEDSVGRNERVIRIKDLVTGDMLSEAIPMNSGDLEWANDSETLFYVKQQANTLIPYRVYRHKLGDPHDEDVLVYEEPDSTFYVALEKSRSDEKIVIASVHTLMSEYRSIDANTPESQPAVFLPRKNDHEYEVEYLGNLAYVRTNWEAENFRLMMTEIEHSADRSQWKEVVPHRSDTYLDDFLLFKTHVGLLERAKGLTSLSILNLDTGKTLTVPADEQAYTPDFGDNPNVGSSRLRFTYESLATPESVFEVDMGSGERTLLKQDEVGGFVPGRYVTRRVHAPARDGARIPITLLLRSDASPDGSNPLYVLGYGAYGASYDPTFNEGRLSLVDRGFVFALAHIRGGQELGRAWYDNGRLLNKRNTFTDFIDATQFLLETGWGDPERVVGSGRSAGGLLIGAVANMAPELYTAIVTEVPFVDVVTTMLDESIPLTTFEWDEWGNPIDREYYQYMLSYSPYDRVEAKDYPHLLVSTGLWDPAVQYWEPAKWVAKLRHLKTDDNRLLLYVDMDAGHRGQPGRFESLAETAREYAFIFDVLGIEDPKA